MNASWKTSTAGIATIVAGVANLIITAIQTQTVTTESAGIAVGAVLGGIGLMMAKDGNVSNSPTPLSVAQPVSIKPVAGEPPTPPTQPVTVIVPPPEK